VSWTDDLAAEPWRFDLIATLRRLEREAPEKPRVGEARRLGDEVVRISQPPFLAFPAANVVGFTRAEGKPPRLDAQFLGLFGPQGPLPLEATEEAHDWGKRREDAIFTRFADLVQGRFLELFFRAWGQSRPIAHNDRPDDDRFRVYLGALIGLGTPTLRDADGLDEFTKMSFAGLMSPRVKSTARLRGLLQGLIDGPVEIDEFVGAWLPLEAADRSRRVCSASATSSASASSPGISRTTANSCPVARERATSPTRSISISASSSIGTLNSPFRPGK
jgi:type VI secretion system protein ImpH